MQSKVIPALLLTGVFAVGQVSAAITVFDFSAPPLTEEDVEGVVIPASSGTSGLTVTASGRLVGGSAAQNANTRAIRTDWGLGVRNGNVANDRDPLSNRFHVDGKDGAEFLRLEFSDKVKITEVFFAWVGAFEKFDLVVDGVDVDVVAVFGTDVIEDLAPPGAAPGTVLLPDTLPFGKTWDFYAPGMGDAWNIERVEVIPEPSTLVVWSLLSILGVVWFRRRQSEVAQGSPVSLVGQ